jgi:signal transduction histidine kinase
MKHEGLWVLDVTVPVMRRDGTIVAAIHMARHLDSVKAEMDRIKWRHGLFVLLAAIGTTLLLSLGTYWLVLRRLHLLDEALRAQDSRRQLPPTAGPRDEIDHLGVVLAGLVDELGSAAMRLKVALCEKEDLLGRVQGFNTRLEQEVEKVRAELTSAQQRLIQAEHLSTIGQLAAGLAHEVRNPLFIIRATAVRLQRKNVGQRAAYDDIIDEVDRVNRIIKRLLEIGRATELSIQEVTLADTLERIADSVRRRLPTGHQVMVNVDASNECRVQGDPHLLRQAFANIVDNAIHAVGDQGHVTIAARHLGDHTLVEVRDDGVGIAKEDVDRIFDPFFSRNLGGTGLGLCSAKKVLDLHGAFVEVESEVGEGTAVRIIFGAFDAEQNPCIAGPT